MIFSFVLTAEKRSFKEKCSIRTLNKRLPGSPPRCVRFCVPNMKLCKRSCLYTKCDKWKLGVRKCAFSYSQFLNFFVLCRFCFLSYRHLWIKFLQFVSSLNAENKLSKCSGHSSLKFPTSSSAHLFAIRGRHKRGPGTFHTRNQNLPK